MAENKIPTDLYPTIKIDLIKHPKKFWAVPVIGFLIKVITIIPISILFGFVGIAVFFLSMINAVYVLFRGTYWQPAYEFAIGYMQVHLKIYFYLFGLTDKFPGFLPQFAIEDSYSFAMSMPTRPNRLFAIPLFGGFARIILMIPYFIYSSVLQNAAYAGAIYASFLVLGKDEYPESAFEMVRDSMRVSLASTTYMFGLSDTYPSFWISMNHKNAKIVFIVIGTLLALGNMMGRSENKRASYNYRNSNSYQQYMQNARPTIFVPQTPQ